MELNSVYRRVAKDCLEKWMAVPIEIADVYAAFESIEELENGNDSHYGVGAKNSIVAGAISLATQLHLTQEETVGLALEIMFGKEKYYPIFSEKLTKVENINETILNALSAIHDNWVTNNSNEKTFIKKESRGQLRQYAPLEMIGWNEVKSDLIFLKPILEEANIFINEEELKEAYNARAIAYFQSSAITSESDIAKLIADGSKYYPTIPEELGLRLAEKSDIVASQIITFLQDNQSPVLTYLTSEKIYKRN